MRSKQSFILLALVAGLLNGCATVSELGKNIGDWTRKTWGEAQPAGHAGTREEAVKEYAYDGKRPLLEVREHFLSQTELTPGESLDVTIRYALLAPDPDAPIVVTESRTLLFGRDGIELNRKEIARSQGIVSSSVRLTLPRGLSKGKYALVTTLIAAGIEKKSITEAFVVR